MRIPVSARFAASLGRVLEKAEPEELLDELLEPKGELFEGLWDGERLRPEVRERLLEIAAAFHDHLDVDAEPRDVQLTGSLANYTWTPWSDVDLHLLYDVDAIGDGADEDLVRDYLQAMKARWNDEHAITIRGHEVEVYPQDAAEPHHSTGVYSLQDDAWVREPARQERAGVDRRAVERKARDIARAIDTAEDCQDCLGRLRKLKEKIRRMRQAGLEERGEYSAENLAFKVLRGSGYLDRLSDMIRWAEDQALSLNGAAERAKSIVSAAVEKAGTAEGAKRGWRTRRGEMAAVEDEPAGPRARAEEDEGKPAAVKISLDWLASVAPQAGEEAEAGRGSAGGEEAEPKESPLTAEAAQQIAEYREFASEWGRSRVGDAEEIRDATEQEGGRRDSVMLSFVSAAAGKDASDTTHTMYKGWSFDNDDVRALDWRAAAIEDMGRTADDEWFHPYVSEGHRAKISGGAWDFTKDAARASKAWSEEVWKAWHGDDPMPVYRGVQVDEATLKLLRGGESAEVGINALSSWSTDAEVAGEFGQITVSMEITPDDVWGYHRAHELWSDNEAEVIVGHTAPRMRLVALSESEEGERITVRAEPVREVAKDVVETPHLDAGDNGNWLHGKVRGQRPESAQAEKARSIVASAIEKAGTSAGAKRGWRTRRGEMAAVEYEPTGRRRGAADDEEGAGRPRAREEEGGPRAGIVLDWMPETSGVPAAEEPAAPSQMAQGYVEYDSGATFDRHLRQKVRGIDGEEHEEGGDYLAGKLRDRLSKLPDHHLTGAAVGQIRVTGSKQDMQAGMRENWDTLWPPETRRGEEFDGDLAKVAGMFFDASSDGEGGYQPTLCVTEDWTGNPPEHVQKHEFGHALMHNMRGPDNPRDPGVELSHRASEEDIAEHRAWRQEFAAQLRVQPYIAHVGGWDEGPDPERPSWEELWQAIWETEIEPLAKVWEAKDLGQELESYASDPESLPEDQAKKLRFRMGLVRDGAGALGHPGGESFDKAVGLIEQGDAQAALEEWNEGLRLGKGSGVTPPIDKYAGVDSMEGFAQMYATFSRPGQGTVGRPGGRMAGADVIKKHMPGTWDFMNVLFHGTKIPEWRAPEPAKAEAR